MACTLQAWSRWSLMLVGSLTFLVGGSYEALAQRKRPRFIHRTPSSVKSSQSVTLRGVITHAADLDTATIKFRKIGARGAFRTRNLVQKGSKFEVTITAREVVVPGIEYYVIGKMFSGRARILAGSLASPLQFLVIKDAGSELDPTRRPPPPRRGTGNTDPDPDPDPDPGTTKKPKRTRTGGGEKLSRAMVTSAASRRLQYSHTAPATTGVITAQDIENYGWRTLSDILRGAGGLDINRSGFALDVGIRGVNFLGNGGNGLLFMIDGHDMAFRQRQQNFVSPAWISVDDIERIEIVRGSMSGVWGVGAFQGVVQIITKSGANMGGYAATLGVGPISGSHFFNVRGGDRFKSGLSVYATLSMTQEFRSPVLSPIFEFTFLNDALAYTPTNDRMLGQNFYFKMDYKGLFFTMHQGRYDTTVPMNQYSILGGDDTRLVTDRIITRVGWQGKVGKTTRLKVWAGVDHTAINPDSTVSFNPLSSSEGNAPDGSSSTLLLTGETTSQYAPSCDSISDPESVCARIIMVSYTAGDADKVERACFLAKRKDNAASSAPKKVLAEQRLKEWYPFPANCRPAYTGGRFQRDLRGADTRLNLGVQLSLNFVKWLHLMGGVEFEYLQASLWHFPSVWAQQTAGQSDAPPSPEYGNFRFGAFLQAQAQAGKWIGIHAAFRLDYDERVAAAIGAQGGVVVTPGGGIFIKANYSLGYRIPSLYEFYSYEDNRYGNPIMFNETIHSINAQIGWRRKRLMQLNINGYFSIINDPIRPELRAANQPPTGYDGDFQFPYAPPKPTGAYSQLNNRIEGITGFGGEVEARIFPLKGFELIGMFGIAFATEVINDQGDVDRVPYSAGLYANLNATYRYKAFRISLGFLYTGSKLVPNTGLNVAGSLPARAILDATQNRTVPSWTADQNPRAPTPDDLPRSDGYIKLHLTIQLLRILDHLDFAIRAQNITGLAVDAYDASNPLLIPHKRFELLAWVKFNY